jgi:hypothetical protein
MDYSTVHDQLVNQAILRGAEYNANNGAVYDLLQSLTLNGPAWSWINSFQCNRDGRGAWQSLSYYEGDAMQTCSKQECYEAIAQASYQGVKRNFDFSSYMAIHQQAHQDLVCLGEPVPENKKGRDFLHGITDPQCGSIKLNILSNPLFMNNFAQTINYMASAIDMITRNTPGGTRQISDIHRGNNFNNNRGNGQQGRAGRGRGRNQNARNTNRGGHGRGQQGRGRGRDSDTQSSWSNHSGQNRSQRISCTQEEWQNMSYQERNHVMRERE